MDTYGHLFSDVEDLGRGVIDAALARNPAKLERNQGGRLTVKTAGQRDESPCRPD